MGGALRACKASGGSIARTALSQRGAFGHIAGPTRRNFLTLQNFSSFLLLPLLPPPLRQQEITRLELILQEKTRQKEELQQSNAELERKERLMKLQVGGAR